MGPDGAVRELERTLGRGGLSPGEARRLRVLQLVARVVGDPDGDHTAAVDEVVDGWARGGVGDRGDASSVTLELPGRAGSSGPVTITAVEGEQGTLDVEVRPGDLPLSVSIGVTVVDGRILLDLSGVPDALPGVDLLPIKRRVLALVAARNRPRGRLRPIPETLEAMRTDVATVVRDLELAGVAVTAGTVREVYGGPAGGDPAHGIPPWQPHGDPAQPEVPPDTIDPVMESVLRELGVPGAGSGPEALPDSAPAAAGGTPAVDPSSLPLVPSGSPVAIEDRPVVALSNNVGVLGTGGDPVRWWVTVRRRYGEEEYVAEVDPRHIDERGDVDLAAVADMLATRGVVVEPRWGRVSPRIMNGTVTRIAGPVSWEPVDPWAAPPAYGTPTTVSGATRTRWMVVAGIGGLTAAGLLGPVLLDGGSGPDEPAAITTTVALGPDGTPVSTEPPSTDPLSTEPPSTDPPPTTESAPSPPVEPPSGYEAPALSFAPDGPPERVADLGSLWGTIAWPTVVSAAKPGAVTGPPPTVYPGGTVLEAEFVIDAACGADGCVYTTPRCCDDTTGLAVDVPLTLDGLTLSGPGDDVTEGCTGDSGVRFTVSDLTVIGTRLVPTYMTGQRWFREDCPTWTRTLENTYQAHYADRPSLTPP